MSERVFGSADDFYRVRVIRVDIPDELEWEWRDDVLWRAAPATEQHSTPRFRVEVVLDDGATALTLAEVATPDAARELAQKADEDLAQLTKKQFDARYGLSATPPVAGPHPDADPRGSQQVS